MESRQKLSVFIVCCNEEQHIERCLKSVSFCDEIVIIDSGSTDRTLEIAKQYTQTIIHKPWCGFVGQKQFGLDSCSHPWVLNVDADEAVSPLLQKEILSEINQAEEKDLVGFELLRVVFFLGRWWRRGGWYPEFRLRLVKKSATRWGGQNPHEHAIAIGKTKRLTGELEHYTYESIADQVVTLNKHSSTAAQSSLPDAAPVGVITLLGRPLVRFIKWYILRGGYKDGIAGLIIALNEAHYAFLKYAKIWELQRKFGK